MDKPSRIRVAQDADGFWTCRKAFSCSQEYVRADILDATLAALREIEAICTESVADCRKRMGTRVGNSLVTARDAIRRAAAA